MALIQQTPEEYFQGEGRTPVIYAIPNSNNTNNPNYEVRYVAINQQDNKIVYVLIGGIVLISIVAIVALSKK